MVIFGQNMDRRGENGDSVCVKVEGKITPKKKRANYW